MRSSQTDPYQIAEIDLGKGFGLIGLGFCPGKAEPGVWARDLTVDLGVVTRWNADTVVTLVETDELEQLGVPDLGQRIAAQGIGWLHLPIHDFAIPDAAFEAGWQAAGAEIREKLRMGRNILIHCKGGLGRTGMIASRLMIELGTAPDLAVLQVRKTRPGAIETAAQLSYVLNQSPK